MEKDNNNPVAVAEQGLAEFLRGVPEISGIFSGAKEIPIYAATDESALRNLAQKIKQAVMQTVLVSFGGIESAARTTSWTYEGVGRLSGTFASAAFAVNVFSPGILSSEKMLATTDLAMAIFRALDTTRFDDPFAAPILFQSWQQEEREGVFVTTLNFYTTLKLNQ